MFIKFVISTLSIFPGFFRKISVNHFPGDTRPSSLNSIVLFFLVAFILICTPAAASVTFTSSSPQILVKGDTFTIHGTDARNGSVSIWVIGKDCFSVVPSDPDRNGNYSLSILPDKTSRFSSGQYAIVVQDPGANGKSDITCHVDKNGNITLLNHGVAIADIGPKQAIGSNAEPVAAIIREKTVAPGIDDIFTPLLFIVEEPSVRFDQKSRGNPEGQLPNMTAGDRVTFTGTTNVGVENTLRADIRNLDTNTLVFSKTLPVIPGSDKNRWSFGLDTTGFSPGEYFMTVGWMKTNTSGTESTLFTLVSASDSSRVSHDTGTSGNPARGKNPGQLFIASSDYLKGLPSCSSDINPFCWQG